MKSNKLLIFCNLLYFYNKLHWLLIIKNYLTVNIVYSMLVFIKITSKLKIIWHRIVLICRYRFIMELHSFLVKFLGLNIFEELVLLPIDDFWYWLIVSSAFRFAFTFSRRQQFLELLSIVSFNLHLHLLFALC